MKILADAKQIDKALVKLIGQYQNYQIATAWASLGSEASKALLANKSRIKKMVVGTHFYQTHPDFIKQFINSNKVHFILKTSGIYHPKVYLFSNSEDDWECIIGSANFTYSALTKNAEIVVQINSLDPSSGTAYKTITKTISDYWKDSTQINKAEYRNYKNIWKNNNKKINSLKGKYGKAKPKKPLVKSKIFSLSWSKYYKLIQNDEFHSFEGRIELLSKVREYFQTDSHYSNLSKIQRREIAGIATSNQTSLDIDWGWFGSMVGAGIFQSKINENNKFISRALDEIPLHGKVNESNYYSFISLFKKAFPEGGSGVAVASRLLAMKRPDYFVCLDKQNRPKLCHELGLPVTVS